MRDEITIDLYERGQWVKHFLPFEISRDIVRDMVKQMNSDDLEWFCLGLNAHQLEKLADSARDEMRERAHVQNPLPRDLDHLKLLGE